MMRISVAGRRLALSFVTAFALWTFVTLTQNPENHKVFDVPLQLQNIPTDLVVVDGDGLVMSNYGTLSVEVWAAINTLNQLRDGDLKAVVDLSKATAAAQQFPVAIVNSRTGVGYMSYKYKPQVELRLDTMKTIELPIRIDMQNYTASSVAFDAPQVTFVDNQNTVTIRAPQMRLKRIKEAKVTVQIENNLTARYDTTVPVVVVDDADKPLTGMTLSPESARINIDVQPRTGIKEVVVLPQIRGYVAPGYQLRAVAVHPVTVSITGGSAVVEQTQSIMTEPIDITNLTDAITKTVRLVLPKNILLLDDTVSSNGDAKDVTVDVGLTLELSVQPVRMRIPVAVTLVDIPDGMNVSVVPSIVTVDVAASPATLQRGALTLIKAVASVGTWDENNRYRQVFLSLPADIKLAGTVPVVQLEANTQPMLPTSVATATPEETTATVLPSATMTATVTATPTKSIP